ncbi:uncharacterized protein LOC118180585 [Stegodyphus dumicola]|uniref:uncharacterized protein LOC118180585 n=1 Tax=Stegodyphus dumicola TaxID=202533 RepID=UPI0015AAC91E|nr:uncharacterized protein LOC118180585 [Stegodyphus dumicola]
MDSGTGSGLCIIQDNCIISTWRRRLGVDNSIFQAELTALQKAIYIASQIRSNVFIHSDSMSSLLAVGGRPSRHPIVIKLQKMLLNLMPSIRPILTWVPAHTGIKGNAIADSLAKEAATNTNLPEQYLPLPGSYVKRTTMSQLLSKWQDRWTMSPTGRRTFKFIPKVNINTISSSSAITTFLTGHGTFPEYLHRFGLRTNDLCTCGQRGTPDDYVFSCQFTSNLQFQKPVDRYLPEWTKHLLCHAGSQKKLFQIIQYCKDHYA